MSHRRQSTSAKEARVDAAVSLYLCGEGFRGEKPAPQQGTNLWCYENGKMRKKASGFRVAPEFGVSGFRGFGFRA